MVLLSSLPFLSSKLRFSIRTRSESGTRTVTLLIVRYGSAKSDSVVFEVGVEIGSTVLCKRRVEEDPSFFGFDPKLFEPKS